MALSKSVPAYDKGWKTPAMLDNLDAKLIMV